MAISFEDIQKASQSLTAIDVKGKPYCEVNQRIKVFRMLYPEGTIATDLISLEDGICVMKATVTTDDGRILGTGTAFEKQDSSFINKTSFIENCETSAVGRALAMCGIGIDVSVASYEEVANAIENQDKPKKDTKVAKVDGHMEIIKFFKGKSEAYKANVLNHFGVAKVEDMNEAQVKEVLDWINKQEKENK